jgi:hypothetical protein
MLLRILKNVLLKSENCASSLFIAKTFMKQLNKVLRARVRATARRLLTKSGRQAHKLSADRLPCYAGAHSFIYKDADMGLFFRLAFPSRKPGTAFTDSGGYNADHEQSGYRPEVLVTCRF